MLCAGVRTFFPGSIVHDLVTREGSSTAGAPVISGHVDKKLRHYDLRQDKPCYEMLMPGKITSLDSSYGS